MHINIISGDTYPALSDTKEEADQKLPIGERPVCSVLLLCKCQDRGD